MLSYCKKTGRRLFLHIKRTKKVQPEQINNEMKKPTKLALGEGELLHCMLSADDVVGVDGGFDGGQVKVH